MIKATQTIGFVSSTLPISVRDVVVNINEISNASPSNVVDVSVKGTGGDEDNVFLHVAESVEEASVVRLEYQIRDHNTLIEKIDGSPTAKLDLTSLSLDANGDTIISIDGSPWFLIIKSTGEKFQIGE